MLRCVTLINGILHHLINGSKRQPITKISEVYKELLRKLAEP